VDVDVWSWDESSKSKQLRVKHFLNRLLGLELVRPFASHQTYRIEDLRDSSLQRSVRSLASDQSTKFGPTCML
jgi:hypothetical protein